MPVDPLSDVLRLVRLTGGIFLEGAFTSPWSFLSSVTPQDCAPFLPKPRQLIGYHLIVEGEAFVSIDGEAPVSAKAGEIVLLPRNDTHALASEPGLTPVKADELLLPPLDGQLSRIVFGGGGTLTRVYCGFLASDDDFNPLIFALPRVLKLDAARLAMFEWVEASMRFAIQELLQGRLASSSTLSRLSELLFVEAVRNYAAREDTVEAWLGAFRDPQIGRALVALHADLRRDWTAELLAREAGMSRSAFMKRFAGIVGETPIKYLTGVRLRAAHIYLKETPQSIARIAERVGYESEEAFSRAFKRAFGAAPSQFRTQP